MRKIAIPFVSIILILAIALSTGCTLLPISPPTSNPLSTQSTPIAPNWTMPPTGGQATALPSIADVVAKVKPAVVAINTEITTLDIFNRPSTEQGAGSGWIIDPNGIVVTNNHVVEGAKNITVTLDDGRTFSVDMGIVATDPVTDLAALRIQANGLPALTVGDSSQLKIGDWVVAIGNALGRGTRATQGIVSSKGVSIDLGEGETLYNLVETTAAINPGNSGGPLVNMAGQVVGITSAKISAVGVEGMGYAISTQEAAPIIQQLINSGRVVSAWLGVSLANVDQFAILRYNLAVDKGALVVDVIAGGPAEKAGIRAGDVITTFAGQDITDRSGLTRAIRASQVGQTVSITYWRGQSQNTASATLAQTPKL
jgi:serine protease Do